jgi:hypothetical protein
MNAFFDDLNLLKNQRISPLKGSFSKPPNWAKKGLLEEIVNVL